MNLTQPISRKQIVKLWAQARELGMDGEALHALVAEKTGKSSVRALTAKEGIKLIDGLVELGASGQGRRLEPLQPGVTRLVTPWQMKRLAELIAQLGWSQARWEGVVRKAIGRPSPRTSTEAAKCIDAVRAILKREEGHQARTG